MSSLTQNFPSSKGIRWFNVAIFTVTPLLAVYGLGFVRIRRETLLFSVAYYIFSMLGITAGYHRLWSHRSYNACLPLQVFLLIGGSSAVQGSCYWWARAHRSHHRYTDTDLDPYNSNRGLLWTHIGWMVVKSDLHSGSADVSDLRRDKLIQWQHRHYFLSLLIFGLIIPIVVPGLFFGDWLGGICFAGGLRLTAAHHCTFCINSIAHLLGEASYDDVLTPRDHVISAMITLGEGYHNFHHQFPMDYRNAFLWYQYDPTKWFIAFCAAVGLAYNLKRFSSNEIGKGRLAMKLKQLKKVQDGLEWPAETQDLPVVSWKTFQEECESRPLMLIGRFIHDISPFLDHHPGGKRHLLASMGREMTAAFFGGVYSHSAAAHNLLSMMRVGVLEGGTEIVEHSRIPPVGKFHIVQRSI